MEKKGTLIVFEGTDGSGKSTQFSRLCQRVEESGRDFRRLRFPRYEEESSALIRMYLKGDFGQSAGAVNAYAASAFYAVDRYASYQTDWREDYQRGGLFLLDRYTTSNAVHQGGKLPAEERRAYFDWLFAFEYEKMELPRPDLVLYLDLPPEKSMELLQRRQAQTGTAGDIHEGDISYLSDCREAALEAAKAYDWKVISCLDERGELCSIEDIHQRVWQSVSPYLTGEA